MKQKELKNLRKELLNLTLEDLRDPELMGSLEEIRMILVDIFSMFKIKARPIVFNKREL